MNLRATPRHASGRSFVEALESRRLLCVSPAGAAPAALHAAPVAAQATRVVTPATKTTISASPHFVRFGSPLTVTATVKPTVKGNPVAGSVEFFDNGSPILTSAGTPLTVPVAAKNKASYTFGVGNLTLWLGNHKVSAQFLSTNSLPGSTSAATALRVSTPKITNVLKNGLETMTVKSGRGLKIHAGQTATVLYTGVLDQGGSIFDYSTAHGTSGLTFTAGAAPAQVIAGFDEGVQGMKVGETRLIAMPSNLGYGASGSQNIPPNAALIFLVKLQSIT